VDRDLPVDRASRLEAHVSACQLCAAFGAGFAALIAQVQQRLREPDSVPADVADRLNAVLDASNESA
jgi:anti-sigma factor RsiW